MKVRLYLVEEIATKKVRLIEASTAALAMKFIAETTHTCAVVTAPAEAARLIASGVHVENANKERA